MSALCHLLKSLGMSSQQPEPCACASSRGNTPSTSLVMRRSFAGAENVASGRPPAQANSVGRLGCWPRGHDQEWPMSLQRQFACTTSGSSDGHLVHCSGIFPSAFGAARTGKQGSRVPVPGDRVLGCTLLGPASWRAILGASPISAHDHFRALTAAARKVSNCKGGSASGGC